MTTTDVDNDQLVEDMLPAAAALACAVTDRDDHLAHRLLTELTLRELHALAVVLAAHVDPDKPFRISPSDSPIAIAVRAAATRFQIPTTDILTDRRGTHAAVDARAVACYVARRAGMTSIAIGNHVGRDHTTVLHACARVGENPRLRRIANGIVREFGFELTYDDEDGIAS